MLTNNIDNLYNMLNRVVNCFKTCIFACSQTTRRHQGRATEML